MSIGGGFEPLRKLTFSKFLDRCQVFGSKISFLHLGGNLVPHLFPPQLIRVKFGKKSRSLRIDRFTFIPSFLKMSDGDVSMKDALPEPAAAAIESRAAGDSTANANGETEGRRPRNASGSGKKNNRFNRGKKKKGNGAGGAEQNRDGAEEKYVACPAAPGLFCYD